jgi:hypothetical protein
LVEHVTENHSVAGSIPALGTTLFFKTTYLLFKHEKVPRRLALA